MEPRGRRLWVEAWRGDEVESRHEVLCAAVGVESLPVLAADPLTYLRSAAKPFQLLPLVVAGGCERFGLEAADLAIMAASHDGTDAHAARVEAILGRLGLDASHLRCGVHRPYVLESLPALDPRRQRLYSEIHNNCSGNHAGMLALALVHGVDPAHYLDPATPGQERIASTLASLAGCEPRVAVDDCGAPCYGMPLSRMAQAYAGLADPEALQRLPAERRRELEAWAPLDRIQAALARIAEAMACEPAWVSGERTVPTRLARALPQDIVAKNGAEGVLCVGHRRHGTALAFKVRDGQARALGPALLHVVDALGWLPEAARAALDDVAEPEIHGRLGQVVGRLRAVPA